MSPDKIPFRFVYTKCVLGYMHDISHSVTNEVTTAKRVQTPPLTQKLHNLRRFRHLCLKELFEKISNLEIGFNKSFVSLLKTY